VPGPKTTPIPDVKAAGDPPAAPAAGEIYKPEGMPDDLVGKTNQETIDKLFSINRGFREAQSKNGAVPKDADGYGAIALPEAVAAKIGDLSNDPAMKIVQKVAHEVGMTDKAYGAFLPKVIEAFDKAGLITDASEFDPKKQFELLAADHKDVTDPREREVVVGKRVTNAKASLDGLLAKGAIDKTDHENLMALLPVATSFRTLEKTIKALSGGDGGVPLPGDGAGSGAGLSESEIDQRMLDPRYDTGHPKYDANFRRETDEMLRKFTQKKR